MASTEDKRRRAELATELLDDAGLSPRLPYPESIVADVVPFLNQLVKSHEYTDDDSPENVSYGLIRALKRTATEQMQLRHTRPTGTPEYVIGILSLHEGETFEVVKRLVTGDCMREIEAVILKHLRRPPEGDSPAATVQ